MKIADCAMDHWQEKCVEHLSHLHCNPDHLFWLWMYWKQLNDFDLDPLFKGFYNIKVDKQYTNNGIKITWRNKICRCIDCEGTWKFLIMVGCWFCYFNLSIFYKKFFFRMIQVPNWTFCSLQYIILFYLLMNLNLINDFNMFWQML